jgi:hypothetical protein
LGSFSFLLFLKISFIRKTGYTARTKGHGSGQAPVWEIGQRRVDFA